MKTNRELNPPINRERPCPPECKGKPLRELFDWRGSKPVAKQ